MGFKRLKKYQNNKKMSIETIVLGAIGVIIPVITTIIGKYINSLIEAQEDLKKAFEDYKKEDAEAEKRQDEHILTLQNKQINGLSKLNELETTIKEERKELAVQIKALSDTIIVLTETIKHLEKEIKKS